MPTARKLKSGSWNCRVFSHYENQPDGTKKRIYESFTCADPSKRGKKECERMAAEWSCNRKTRARRVTVLDAVNTYIDAKSSVLSPSTKKSYMQYRDAYFDELGDMAVRDLDDIDVQRWVSGISSKRSAKTTRNIYGFFTAAMRMAGRRDFNVTLPQKEQKYVHSPEEEDVRALIDYLQKPGKEDLRRAVMLAAFCSLRRSEICALTDADILDSSIRINKAMIITPDGLWAIKAPKTTESDRYADAPDFLLDDLRTVQGKIVNCTPDQLTSRFRRAIKYSCVTPFRFHDLRHYYVSISHALGIPDAYIMQNGGWKTDYVMKSVYRDALKDRNAMERNKLHSHFRDAFHDA